MITVIIPALNEEKTIGQVVRIAKQSPQVTEVIMVDDKSMDNTIEEARKEGASIITSTRLGKGASMKDGVLVAKNEIIAFNGENDICCIRKAGIGVSFCSTNHFVDSVSDYVIKEPDFNLLIPILK